MAKMGRPQIEINWTDFDKLCSIHCTLVEISEWFDCSEDTIERAVKKKFKMTFAEYFKRKSATGKISLRRRMFETAMSNNKGSVTMQIWLSKQHLGMTDKVDQNLFAEIEENVVYNTGFGNGQIENSPAISTTSRTVESPSVDHEIQPAQVGPPER